MNNLDEEVERQVAAWRSRASTLAGRHVAVEALWDGDTDGWMLDVAVVTARGDGFFAQHVGTLRYGGDLRLFNGQVPPWPEALVARQAGERLAGELGVEFYFPSPEQPDDDCPHWWARDAATPCRSCGKPLSAGRGPHVPTDQCLPCLLADERNQRLATDAPGHDGNRIVYCVIESGGRMRGRLFLNLTHARNGVTDRLAALLRERRPPVELSERVDTTLRPAEAVAMRAWCAETIDARLRDYVPREGPSRRALNPRTIRWRGEERTLHTFFDAAGEEIAALLGDHAFFEACEGAEALHLFGNGEVTHRDVAFLCFAAARGGSVTVGALCEAFPVVPAGEVERTLAKLEARGVLVRVGDAVELLLKGRTLDVAGP